MKKILSLVVMFVCLMVPFTASAASYESPTIESLWWTEPPLDIQIIKLHDEAIEYLELINTYYDLEGFNEMVLGTYDYALVDMIIVTLDKPYQRVVWHTPYSFMPTDNLSVFMIATDLMVGYVMNARGDKDGNLVVNYNDIAAGNYFMIIYSAD